VIKDVEKLVRPHVRGLLNEYRPDYKKHGGRLHIMYKEGQGRSTWLEGVEILLTDGTLVKDRGLVAYGMDDSVRVSLDDGFVYLGIGIIHKL
jgi:hypothetical protein